MSKQRTHLITVVSLLCTYAASLLDSPDAAAAPPLPPASTQLDVQREPLTDTAVTQAIAELASPSRAIRTAAEETLIRGGPLILDQLPMIESIPDPAVRDSLDRVIHEIERVESAMALKPRRVDLATATTWQAAIDQLAQQTGNRLDCNLSLPAHQPERHPVQPVTFWEGVSWMESSLRCRYAGGRLFPTNDEAATLLTSLDGPFRVELINQSLRTTSGGRKLLQVKLRVLCEPRLQPLFLMAAVDEWQVADGQESLTAFAPGSRLELSANREGSIDVAFDFVMPEGSDPAQEWTITGGVELTLAVRSSTIVFSDLTAKLPISRRRGQATLSLLSANKARNSTSIRVASAYPQLSGLFESYRASLLAPTLALEVNSGQPVLAATEMSQIQEDPKGLILDFQFPAPLTPSSRLHATLPTLMTTQVISFRFESVTIRVVPN